MAEGGKDVLTETESERTPTSIAEKIRLFEGQLPLMGSETWRKRKAMNHPAALTETTTAEVGENRRELEIADCKVTFHQGTFTDVQEVTVTAEVNPETWPPGREAVTPMLHVDAHKLLRQATVKLHTWCAYDGRQQTVEVMRYDETTKEWEMVQFCTVSESRFIEFHVEHFSWVIAVWRTIFSASYIMRPVVYFSRSTFVVALLRDTKLQVRKFQQEMKTFFTSGYEEKRMQAIECGKDDEIKTSILCVKPSRGFGFLPQSMYIHSVRYIVSNSRPSYQTYDLTSDKPSQLITIKVEVEKYGEVLSQNCFGFCWNGDGDGTPHHHIYDIHGGKMVVNVRGTAYLAGGDIIQGSTIGTLNKGEINNENHGLTGVVTGKPQATADSTISVEKARRRSCESEENIADTQSSTSKERKEKTIDCKVAEQTRKMTFGEYFKNALGNLDEQQKKNELEVFCLLSNLAAGELTSTKGQNKRSLENFKDHIAKSSSLSTSDMKAFGCKYPRLGGGSFLRAMIFFHVYYELRTELNTLSSNEEEVEWRRELLSDIRGILKLSKHGNTESHRMAIKLGLEAVEKLEQEINKIGGGAIGTLKFVFEMYADVVKALVNPFKK